MKRSKFQQMMEQAGKFSPQSILSFLYHLPNFIRLGWRLLNDRRVPLHLKLICYAAMAYTIFPYDLLPDISALMAGIGIYDDLIFLFLAFKNLIDNAPSEIVLEHVQRISEGKK